MLQAPRCRSPACCTPNTSECSSHPVFRGTEEGTSSSSFCRAFPLWPSLLVNLPALAPLSPQALPAHQPCVFSQFFIMLLIIFLLELTVVILFFVYTDKIDKYAQRDLKKGLHLYGTDGNIGLTNAWSIIQTDFRCCGVSNYTDWFEVYNTTRVPDSCCLEFSENCGLHSPGTWWKAPCYETVKIWLQENLLAVGIFGLCTALVQILGLTFAMTMYCQVVKADTYCA
uniref:Tetraspanin-4 n=1 Tax=Cairina moschata TaxID=8855 RepID=A0A8C3BJZ6_CAIMO